MTFRGGRPFPTAGPRVRSMRLPALLALGLTLACTSGAPEAPAEERRFPDVVDARATRAPDGSWTFHVTLSSPYDTPARYADAWRVLSPAGDTLAIRELAHDHAAEQPFTRSLSGVKLGDGLERVRIEGRDKVHGWGGATVELEL